MCLLTVQMKLLAGTRVKASNKANSAQNCRDLLRIDFMFSGFMF
jgi:hypothetical protein